MNDAPELWLNVVSERDIGLLVVEELAASKPFVQWFLENSRPRGWAHLQG